MKHVEVVCAIIKKDDRYFCCQRGPGRALAYKWEFPGGKIESNETKEAALVREIKEELKSDIKVISYIGVSNYEYKDLVYFVAYNILKNSYDTEELVQDVFVKMLREIDKFDGRFFKAWLLKMTKNLAINKLKTLNKEDTIEESEVEFLKADDEFKKRDYLIELEEILDEKNYKVVILHLVYDLKHREIAEYLDLPLGTVCSMYNNSMKKIKSIYKKGGNR